MSRPLKQIFQSEKDKVSLLKAEKNIRINQDKYPNYYRDRVVTKPWGYEFLIFENKCVAIWFLFIKKDHATSMHCHPSKKTSLTLLFGKALCNTFRHRNFLATGDSVIFDKAVFHSTKALSLDGIFLIEAETPSNKIDLIRLNDNYGRENNGYEGISEMVTENLDLFNHFYFEEGNCHGNNFTVDGKFSISMEVYVTNDEFQRQFMLYPGEVYCVCKGALLNQEKSIVLNVGETERGSYLRSLGKLNIINETVLMKLAVFS